MVRTYMKLVLCNQKVRFCNELNKVNRQSSQSSHPDVSAVEDVVVVVNRDKISVDFDPGYRAFSAKFSIVAEQVQPLD